MIVIVYNVIYMHAFEFFYDDSINSQYFESEANHIGFRAGGVCPICPKCEIRCRTQEAIEYDRSRMTVKFNVIRVKTENAPTNNSDKTLLLIK